MRRVAKVLLGTATAALIAAGPLAPSSGAAAPFALASASSCTQATNIEAIVDDSISMEFTDASRLRVQAMNLLIDTLGKSTQLGAVEFGSARLRKQSSRRRHRSSRRSRSGPTRPRCGRRSTRRSTPTTAPPTTTAPSPSPMLDNPSADARIFLTDGGHTVGTYNEAHLVHNVPTYVVGFGGVACRRGPGAAAEDRRRYRRPATSRSTTPAQLQSVMNSDRARR